MRHLYFYLALILSFNCLVLSNVAAYKQAMCELGNSTNINAVVKELISSTSEDWLCDASSEPLVPICSWQYIVCDAANNITGIGLGEGLMEGSLPASICTIDTLNSLVVKNNKMNGSIPTCIGDMTNLALLSIETLPNLTGHVPSGLGLLTKLGVLKFISLDISGSIPTAVWTFPHLYDFQLRYLPSLADSVLPGSAYLPSASVLTLEDIPMSGRLTDLQLSASPTVTPPLTVLKLVNVGINGSLPQTLGNLTKIVTLQLEGLTQVTGTLPANLFDLSLLETLIIAACPNITGSLPGGFTKLGKLVVLFVQDMLLTGSIDSSLGTTTNLLRVVFISNPLIAGPVPEALFAHSGIGTLDFTDMPMITGTIPTTLGLMTECGTFNIENTAMNGPIPASIGQMPLANLRLSGNSFSSSIPSQIGSLTKLINIDISKEVGLTGSLPDTLGNLAQLTVLLLYDLPGITGSLPSTLNGMSSIVTMQFARLPRLTGTIPSDLGTGMVTLDSLLISNTSVHGPVPDAFSGMTAANGIYVSDNSLSGTIPSSLCALNALSVLDFSLNNISCFAGCLFSVVPILYGDADVFACPTGRKCALSLKLCCTFFCVLGCIDFMDVSILILLYVIIMLISSHCSTHICVLSRTHQCSHFVPHRCQHSD